MTLKVEKWCKCLSLITASTADLLHVNATTGSKANVFTVGMHWIDYTCKSPNGKEIFVSYMFYMI